MWGRREALPDLKVSVEMDWLRERGERSRTGALPLLTRHGVGSVLGSRDAGHRPGNPRKALGKRLTSGRGHRRGHSLLLASGPLHLQFPLPGALDCPPSHFIRSIPDPFYSSGLESQLRCLYLQEAFLDFLHSHPEC